MTLISNSTESLNSDVDPTAKIQEVENSSSVDSLVSGLQKKHQILKTAQKSQQSPTKSVESAASANNNNTKNSEKEEDFHEKNTKNQASGAEGFQKAFKRFNSGSKNSTSLGLEQEKKAAAEEKIIEVPVDPIKIVNGKEEFYLRFDQDEQDLQNSKLKAELLEKKNNNNIIPKVNGKEELYLRFVQDRRHFSKLEEEAEFEHSKNTGSIAQWAKNPGEKYNLGCLHTKHETQLHYSF